MPSGRKYSVETVLSAYYLLQPLVFLISKNAKLELHEDMNFSLPP